MEKEWNVTKGVGVLYTKETSAVLESGVKSSSIPPVTCLQRSFNSKQPLSTVADRSSLPRSSRLLIQNISQKCSRDDRKMTLGGLHGHGTVHSTGVGTPMVPRGSRYTPPTEVQRTTASRTNDISIVLIWQSSFESLTRRRSGASQKALECYIRRRRR